LCDTLNWRAPSPVNHEVEVNLIGSTTTKTGLRIRAVLDLEAYPKGPQVGNSEVADLRLMEALFHGDWNHTIMPGSH